MPSFDDVKDLFRTYKFQICSVVVAGTGFIAWRWYFAGGVCHSKRNLNGKTVLITGANCGIGKKTAEDLARRGAKVLLACRDITKAERAAQDISKTTGNPNVKVYVVDLASLQSVRKLAKEIVEKENRLDILVNNAGIMACPQWKSEDGYDLQFAVNHLGHFLLTNLLLDLLKKSASSRIVNVSSRAHQFGKIHVDDINLDKDYNPYVAYSQSKLANVLFTRELARRLQGTNVTVNALHPGVVQTELFKFMLSSWKIIFTPFALLLLKTSEQGAQTSIYCCVAEELDGVTGKYFSDCKEKKVAPQALDDEAARNLWDLSEKMVGLKL